MDSLESHGHLSLEPVVRESLLAMSSATIDRQLAPIRPGGRIKRQPHPPRMPLQRLLTTGQVSEERADQLRELQRGSDPLALLEMVRRYQGQLAVLASGEQDAGLRPGAAGADRTQESRSLSLGKRSASRPKGRR
ncbi:MAG: hypothetical protein WAM11_04010 [Cyanobium sp.]